MKSFVAIKLALTACLAISSLGIAQESAPKAEAAEDTDNTPESFSDSQASASDMAISSSSSGKQDAGANGERMSWAQSDLNCRSVRCFQHVVPCFQSAIVANNGVCCTTDPMAGIDYGYGCQTIQSATYSHPCGCHQAIFVVSEESVLNCATSCSSNPNVDEISAILIPMTNDPIPVYSCEFACAAEIHDPNPRHGLVEFSRQPGPRSRRHCIGSRVFGRKR